MGLMPLSAEQETWFEVWNETEAGQPGSLDALLGIKSFWAHRKSLLDQVDVTTQLSDFVFK
jgi:hypothetical protein